MICALVCLLWVSSWQSTHFSSWIRIFPCFDKAAMGLMVSDASGALYQQSFTSLGSESSYCCIKRCLNTQWMPFSSFLTNVLRIPPVCVQLWSCCSPHWKMTHFVNARKMRDKLQYEDMTLNTFAVISVPLPHGSEAIQKFKTVCVKGEAVHAHHFQCPICNVSDAIHVLGLAMKKHKFGIFNSSASWCEQLKLTFTWY